MDFTTVSAVLFGILTVVALAAGVRALAGGLIARRRAAGWLALGVAAAVQVMNLLGGYSWLLSALCTLGLAAGIVLLRRADGPPPDR